MMRASRRERQCATIAGPVFSSYGRDLGRGWVPLVVVVGAGKGCSGRRYTSGRRKEARGGR